MKNGFILVTFISSLFFSSCQKEIDFDNVSNNSNSTVDLSGTWKFINFRAKTLVINDVIDAGDTVRTVTTSDYTTENNTGTVVFNAQSMSYDNLSYSINALARVTLYENSVFFDSFSMPMQVAIPPTTGQVTFSRIGADSLYFQSGSFVSNGISQTPKPSGAKIKVEQDKIYLTQTVNELSTTTDQGQILKSNQHAEIVTVLQKQ